MDFSSKSRRQELVKTEEKQTRLDQFFGFYLDRIFADWGDRPDQHRITVIARSPASPVARALMLNAEDIREAGIEVRALFCNLEPNEALGEWFDFVIASNEVADASPAELRHAANPALLDAHEQLVLGSEMSWTGDAMRREPSQRDTIEIYDPCCDRTAGQSLRSFDALWGRSDRMKIANHMVRAPKASGQEPDVAGDELAVQDTKIDTTSASTRH